MNKRLADLAGRKQVLIDQCAREREELWAACGAIHPSTIFGGTLSGIVKALKVFPVITAAISSFLIERYAGRLGRPVGKAFKFWGVAKPLWSWWSKRRQRP